MSTGNHEFDLIQRICQHAAPNASVAVGIGDDAAVIRSSGGAGTLVAKDVLTEGVHFDLSAASPAQVGRKALAVNLSDIAAMAGRPTAAFVGLVLPAARGAEFAEGLMEGVLTLAAEFDVAVAGGDTNIWNGPAAVSVTVLGETSGRGAVLRRGAQPGDWLLVTGALGGSLRGRHLMFPPRIREALALHRAVEVHAMIDISDGLASDIHHVLNASQVGARLNAAAVPVHGDVPAALSPSERLQHALSDGEDFELLVCVDRESGRTLLADPPSATQLTHIGEITAEEGCWLQSGDGSRRRMHATGWEHRFAPG